MRLLTLVMLFVSSNVLAHGDHSEAHVMSHGDHTSFIAWMHFVDLGSVEYPLLIASGIVAFLMMRLVKVRVRNSREK